MRILLLVDLLIEGDQYVITMMYSKYHIGNHLIKSILKL